MRCNLCRCEIVGYGNNPAPLAEGDSDRCCDSCDGKYVIPARLYEITFGRFTSEEVAKLVNAIRKENEDANEENV